MDEVKGMESIPTGTLSYQHLAFNWRKGFRNGNWRKLNSVEKALYMASISLAKMRGRIVNANLIQQLGCIVGKLRETVGSRLMKAAYRRAMELHERYVSIGLFEWAPQARSWFDDPSYVFWLGLSWSDPPMHL